MIIMLTDEILEGFFPPKSSPVSPTFFPLLGGVTWGETGRTWRKEKWISVIFLGDSRGGGICF